MVRGVARVTLVLVAVLLVGGALMVVNPPPALACSCGMGTMSPDKLPGSPVVFEGRPVTQDADGRWTFRVERVFRGSVAADQVVLVMGGTQGASCGLSFVLGEPHLVDARVDEYEPAAVRTSLCSMTQTMAPWTAADRQDLARRLGPGALPRPPAGAGEFESRGPDGVGILIAVGVAAGAVIVGTVVLRTRRRSRQSRS